MSEGISEDDWRAEIDRVQAQSILVGGRRTWTDEERRIVLYGRAKLSCRQLLATLNRENDKAGRSLRTLVALESFIARLS